MSCAATGPKYRLSKLRGDCGENSHTSPGGTWRRRTRPGCGSDPPRLSRGSGRVFGSKRPLTSRPAAVRVTVSPGTAATSFPTGDAPPGQLPRGTYSRVRANSATWAGRQARTIVPRAGTAAASGSTTRYSPTAGSPSAAPGRLAGRAELPNKSADGGSDSMSGQKG